VDRSGHDVTKRAPDADAGGQESALPEAIENPQTLAEKIDFLFRKVRNPRGGEYSYKQAAQAIQDNGGEISSSYLWLLRNGERNNPTMKHLEALASFFGVPEAYFFDEKTATDVHEQLALLALVRDLGVRKVALRASGLSRGSLDVVTTMLEALRKNEGLPEETDLPGSDPRD
jgi:transcriptional regulator with XRE-family HTH domain